MKYSYSFILILLVGQYALAESPDSVSRLTRSQQSSLRQYIKARELNICYDDQVHEPVGPLKLKKLDSSCRGRPMYLLELSELRFKVDGKLIDCAGYHEGSAGGPTPLLAWDSKKNKFTELFWGLVRKGPAVTTDARYECPALQIEVHPTSFDGLDASAHVAELRYNAKKDRYQKEIIRLKDGNIIRSIKE